MSRTAHITSTNLILSTRKIRIDSYFFSYNARDPETETTRDCLNKERTTIAC